MVQDSEPDGARGDILCNGFQGHGNKQTAAIVDVRITDLDAPSHRNRADEKVLESQEKQKKAKYLEPCFNQCRSFTPFRCFLQRAARQRGQEFSKTVFAAFS